MFSSLQSVKMNASNTTLASKDNNVKEFNLASTQFFAKKSDKTCALLERHLQFLCNATDPAAFNPKHPEIQTFFKNLSKLFVELASGYSQVIWSCVNVLTAACNDGKTHLYIKENFEFVQHLTKLLSDNLTKDQKIRVLKILLDLTCGVDLEWYVPSIQHLTNTLIRWIKHEKHDDVVYLSLCVIANVNLKNQGAQYVLSQAVHVPELCKDCLKFTDNKFESCAAKLMLIIDHMRSKVGGEPFGRLMHCTLKSINEALIVTDHLDLRQHVYFFLRVDFGNANVKRIVSSQCNPSMLMQDLLSGMSRAENGKEDAALCECFSLLFKFLDRFVSYNLPAIHALWNAMTSSALQWVDVETVAPDALKLLHTILLSAMQAKQQTIVADILEEVVHRLGILTHEYQELNTDKCRAYYYIYAMIKIHMNVGTEKVDLSKVMQREHFERSLSCLMDSADSEQYVFTDDAVSMFACALSVLCNLGNARFAWDDFTKQIYSQKQVRKAVSLALASKVPETRKNALEVLSKSGDAFRNSVADTFTARSEPQSPEVPKTKIDDPLMYKFDGTAYVARVKIDDIRKILCEMRDDEKLPKDVTNIVDLYEDRLAISRESEETLSAFVESKSVLVAGLKRQLSDMSNMELRSRQLHLRSEQKRNDEKENILELQAQVKELQAEKAKCIKLEGDLNVANADILSLKEDLEKTNADLARVTNERDAALHQVIPHLQERLTKWEKISQRNEGAIKMLHAEIQSGKKALQEEGLKYQDIEEELRAAREELQATREDLQRTKGLNEERGTLLEQIMQLTHGKMK